MFKNERVSNEALKILETYRSVFGTPEGRLVLSHMLVELGVFNEITDSEGEVELHNFGIRLLAKLGVIKPENVQNIADSLMNIPVRFNNQT